MPIDELTLTQYALGILDEKEADVVRKKLKISHSLQQELVSIESVLHNMALAEKSQLPSEILRDKVLGSVQEKTRYHGFIDRIADIFDLNKQVSEELLAKIDNIAHSDWESTVFPGVSIMQFAGGPRVDSATCGIVQVKSGVLFPAHQHQGDEEILVLKGVARDDSGKEFAAGDIYKYGAGSQHSFRIISDETFVFAVVLQKNNKWLLFKTLLDHLRL